MSRVCVRRQLVSEGLGTALLLAIVVGSGIMGEQLAAGNTALALLANSLATGAGLLALILMFGPLSGAHFNPLVTLAAVWQGELPRRLLLPIISVQTLGALVGVACAHLMFAQPMLGRSEHVRSGLPLAFSEVVASFGLIAVILSCQRHHPQRTPFAVAAYISSAYWFTASTSFANPAVTLARAFTPTFAGIRLTDVPLFVAAQLVGLILAVLLMRWLLASPQQPAS